LSYCTICLLAHRNDACPRCEAAPVEAYGPDAPEDVGPTPEIPLPWGWADWAATITVTAFLGALAYCGADALGWLK
jgi:hypothetical protein